MFNFIKVKSKLLKKYIISYLLIFLIPFIIMSFVIYKNSVGSLQSEIEQSNINNLEQTANIITSTMKELQNITAIISYNANLTPYMIQHDFYGLEAVNELKRYKTNNITIEEVFLYYHDSQTLISSSGLYSISTLLEKFQFYDWREDDLIKNLKSRYPNIFHASLKKNQDQMIVLFNPIIPNNPYPFGSIVFFIKESVLTDLIKNVVGNFQGNTYVLDESNNIITSFESDPDIQIENIALMNINNDGINRIKYDGNKYFIATVKSEFNNWKYVTIMNTKQFSKSIIQKKTIVLAILISLFLVGLSLAIILGRKQYKPIGHLFQLTKSEGENALGKNELESIHSNISNVIESHKKLHKKVDLQRPFVKEQVLFQFLKGDLPESESTEALLNNLNIKMHNDLFYVAILDMMPSENASIEDWDSIEDILSTFLVQDTIIHPVDLIFDGKIAMILSANNIDNNSQDHRKYILPKIQNHFQSTLGFTPVIGVGRIYDKKSFINRSYIEALTTMDYHFTSTQNSIIYFEEIPDSPKQFFEYPQEELMKLIQSLKQGDKTVAIEALHTLFKNISSKNLSVYELKCVNFDIINSILKTVAELNVSEAINNLDEIVHFNTLKQLENNLQSVILKICQQIELKREDHNEQLKKRILDYIHDNYKTYDLSLGELARRFDLSVPYVSRFIRSQVGTTFSQYVFGLRIQHVKKELKETDKLIKDIIIDVGYQDVSNFIRQFKKVEGLTPGQYRKSNKN